MSAPGRFYRSWVTGWDVFYPALAHICGLGNTWYSSLAQQLAPANTSSRLSTSWSGEICGGFTADRRFMVPIWTFLIVWAWIERAFRRSRLCGVRCTLCCSTFFFNPVVHMGLVGISLELPNPSFFQERKTTPSLAATHQPAKRAPA